MFDGTQQTAKRQLVSALKNLGCTIKVQTDDYVYATSNDAQGGTVTDLEFLFAANDNTVSNCRVLDCIASGCCMQASHSVQQLLQ